MPIWRIRCIEVKESKLEAKQKVKLENYIYSDLIHGIIS